MSKKEEFMNSLKTSEKTFSDECNYVVNSVRNFLKSRETINPNLSEEAKEIISELLVFFEDYPGKNRKIVQQAIKTDEKKVTQIYPMMPTIHNAFERARLRDFERNLLTGLDDTNIRPKIDIER